MHHYKVVNFQGVGDEQYSQNTRKRKGRNGREGLGFTIWAIPNLAIPQFWRVVFVFSERPSAPKIT
jgi:hypothetical protein